MKYIHIFTVFTTAESFFDGQFKYLADKGNDIILVSSQHPNANKFAERNHIRFIPVEMPRALSLHAILKAIKSICSIIRHEKPDAVFGHTPVGALCAIISARLCGIKKRIYYRHGVIYTTMKGLKYYFFKIEEKFVSYLATSIINVSHSLSNLALKDKLNSNDKQFVIGYGTCGGIDAINIFNPTLINTNILQCKKNALNIGDSDIIFGFTGRICVDKGIIELIEGFKLFQQKHTDIKSKLVLIGTMDKRDILPQHTKYTISNDQNIILTGWINKSEIPYYYSMLDIFVFPSHREGFGMCVLEASAMEKPILVSKSHGCVDSIIEHETGEYINLTSESICSGMECMMNYTIRERLGKNGRRIVVDRYDYRVMWPLINDLYKQIIK